MRLLLDEMFPATVAEQLRARGHDVVSLHEGDYRRLEGAPDQDVFEAALADERALVTENVPDFSRLEIEALGRGEHRARLIFTTDRAFPRGKPATIGRLIRALDHLLSEVPRLDSSIFLKDSGP